MKKATRKPGAQSPQPPTRLENDSLGEVEVPSDALYGVQTVRSVRNLSFSGRTVGQFPVYVNALAMVKKAAARANRDAGLLPPKLARAIERACDDLIAGGHADQFPIDLFAGGGEIAVNMNLNEVIANLANESLGARRGDYAPVHPKDHVNASQSTADVCHTAARVAILRMWNDLEPALDRCHEVLHAKARELAPVTTLARTCLRDAEPASLGEFLGGQAQALKRRTRELARSVAALHLINLGGTAIGSGSGTSRTYRARVIRHLRDLAGIPLRTRANLYDAAQNIDDLGEVAAKLGLLAEVLIKIASDLRLLSSGPEGGFGELNLPAVQEGSSFFPGKINPVVPETMLQCCFQVLGCERTVRLALERGELNLNVFAGSAVANLFEMISMMRRTVTTFTENCINGLTANDDRR